MKDTLLQKANAILGTSYRNWAEVSSHKGLTEDFIREFADEVNWNLISIYQHLSEDIIREFSDKVDWGFISMDKHLSEDFIREYKHEVGWFCVSKFQRLSEDFIREFKGLVSWGCISKYQRLSEDFIREFKNRVNWDFISEYQRLSEDFIRKFKNKVNWYYIFKYQGLSKEFIEEFKGRGSWSCIADSWHYKSAEEKKKAVIDTGLYECHEDYFIAYKGIRKDRYSRFNFQYQYLKGETCETWCDCSDDEDSFGFSAWTKDMARKYYDELVVRVKVRYEDVGRVVHKGGKIRCFKLEVLD